MQFLIYQFESISKLAKLTPSHLQPTLNTDLWQFNKFHF